MTNYNKELWKQVMALKTKETRTKGIANTLTDDEISTIIATMEFFGTSGYFLAQVYWDLTTGRYRIFDWIGMCVMGRWHYQEGDEYNKQAVKVMVHSFLKSNGDIDKWIEDLRITDYDINREWEKLEV